MCGTVEEMTFILLVDPWTTELLENQGLFCGANAGVRQDDTGICFLR